MRASSIDYRILGQMPERARRSVSVEATPAEIESLEVDGYLIRERLVSGTLLDELRAACDELERRHLPNARVHDASFGGLFIRNVIDLHPAFHELFRFGPLLSVARALLGPQVQIHGNVIRVSYPDQAQQAVEWHFHQQVVPEPRPAFFSRPAVLDNLIYLDDIDDESGPLLVVPGTHRADVDLPAGDFSDKPGQVVVTCPAGSVVTAHAALWHRARAPKPGAPKRRLLIWGYSPTWMKQVDSPSAGAGRGLTDGLVSGADDETRELLGIAGFM
jgi:ectoine hydroxylase-related dioxygenase (phytanoyl-CoA dioxygenase family)